MFDENSKLLKKPPTLADHIFKSIAQPITEPVSVERQPSFTTKPRRPKRRGRNLIRARCLELLDILRENGYTYMIPLEQAKELFQIEMGIMDRASLKAYFGS